VPAEALGPNLIIDGGLSQWPDGTTFTGIADSTWGPAGLIYRKAGAVVHDLLRSTDVPAVAALNPGPNYSCQLDVTTADASIAAGDYSLIATRIEGYNWKQFLSGRQFTVPFWVKAAKTGIHYVFARNSGNDRSCVMPYTIAAANTWEYHSVTFPSSPPDGTWDYTTGRGIEIGWTLSCGSTYQTTSGSWQTGNFYAASDQVNETDDAANNFRIALLGPPTAGAWAAPFVALPFGLEELRVQRYVRIWAYPGTGEIALGQMYSTTQAICQLPLSCGMRSTVTVTPSNVAHFALSVATFGLGNVSALATYPSTPQIVALNITTNTGVFVAGNATMLLAQNASASLSASSRIP
jgi:hypothetical protein